MNPELMFVTHPTRTPLSAQEVSYWKRSLARILKIGAEFEFNLPEKTADGGCKGKSLTCLCKNYHDPQKDCWQKCARQDFCKATADKDTCRLADTCTKDTCNDCAEYEFVCSKCVDFVSMCSVCTDFKIDCKACKRRFDIRKDPEAIRKYCTNLFKPSGNYGSVSQSGVHNITTDGSLLGNHGMEIITTGRRVDFWEFYTMTKKIIDEATDKGAYVNERCSTHMHCLASYYDNPDTRRISELEKAVPEIILANFHQLVRRYQNAITWMGTGLDDMDHLTRWEKFRVSVLPVSATTKDMKSVFRDIYHLSGDKKYGWVNYKFCAFDPAGDLSKLHVEMRTLDGLLCPSAIAAFSCLYYALFIKATELSRYGVMLMGDDDYVKQAQQVKEKLLNNTANWDDARHDGRLSDTSLIKDVAVTLVEQSFELLAQVKHILSTVGPAYDVLEKLAQKPCSIRRCEGDTWEQIEQALCVDVTHEDKLDYYIHKLIDTRSITCAKNPADWIAQVADKLVQTCSREIGADSAEELKDRVTVLIEDAKADGDMIWATKIGSMITI